MRERASWFLAVENSIHIGISQGHQGNSPVSVVLVTQLYLTLCNPMDGRPPGSSVHGFSRQKYLRGLPFPCPGDIPDPGIELVSPALQADSLLSEPKAPVSVIEH